MSILQRLLNKVENQVSEDFFVVNYLKNLVQQTLMTDYADTNGFAPWRIVFFHILSTNKTTIL